MKHFSINLDKKLTSFMVLATFIVTNIINIKLPENDPRKIQFEINAAQAAARKQGLPFALRPYVGTSDVISASMLHEDDAEHNKNYETLSKKMAVIEEKVELDDLANTRGVRAVNTTRFSSLGKTAPSSKSSNVYNTRKTRSRSTKSFSTLSPSPTLNTDGTGGSITIDPVPGKFRENNQLSANAPSNSPGGNVYSNWSDPGFGGGIAGGRKGRAFSQRGMAQNQRLENNNNRNMNYWKNEVSARRSYNYRNYTYKKMDLEGAEDNEKESTDMLVDKIEQGQNNTMQSAQDKYNQAANYAHQSNSKYDQAMMIMAMGIALVIIGMGKDPVGWPLIIAGLAMIVAGLKMMNQGQQQGHQGLAGNYSEMGDMILDDGLTPSLRNSDYINDRLRAREYAMRNYSRKSYLTTGRGDPRNKIAVYANNHSSLHNGTRVTTIKASNRGRSTLRPSYRRAD